MALKNERIRLFLTLKERLYRDALLHDLMQQTDIDFVGEAVDGAQTLQFIAEGKASTLLIEEDLGDIDGLTVSEMLISKQPSLSIVLLVDKPVSQNRLAIYLDSGVKAVVSKQQAIQELVLALHYTRNGQIYIGNPYHVGTAHSPFTYEIGKQQLDRFEGLSDREQEVAKLLADHLSLVDIASQLGVSNKTIHTYKDRIFVKLGFEKPAELVLFIKRITIKDLDQRTTT